MEKSRDQGAKLDGLSKRPDGFSFHVGCGGGLSHNGGANRALDCHRFELNVGFVRVGLSCALPLGMQITLNMCMLIM